MSDKTCYRKLSNYKYQLVKTFCFDTSIIGFNVDLDFIKLTEKGVLTVAKNYAWDGASGPTWDTDNSMRGSLVHDAFYQLLRLGEIPQNQIIPIDKLFQQIIIADGMSRFRAWIWYNGLRLAKGKAAKEGTEKPLRHICLPK